jgi:hypothetical protein
MHLIMNLLAGGALLAKSIAVLGEHGRAKACIGSLEQPLLLVLCPLPLVLNLLELLLQGLQSTRQSGSGATALHMEFDFVNN